MFTELSSLEMLRAWAILCWLWADIDEGVVDSSLAVAVVTLCELLTYEEHIINF